MNLQTIKNSIATLQKLRDAHYNQLDTSAQSELDEVLQQLRNMLESTEKQSSDKSKLIDRTLRIISITIYAVTNISDWMN